MDNKIDRESCVIDLTQDDSEFSLIVTNVSIFWPKENEFVGKEQAVKVVTDLLDFFDSYLR